MTSPGGLIRHADLAATLRMSPEWRLAHSFQGRELAQHQLSPYASVLAAFARVAAARPDAALVTEMVAAAPATTVTYGAMLRAVARRAQALELLGVPRRSRVGLRPRNSISDLTDILAVLWQGSAAVLANPADAPSRVAAWFNRLQVLDLACLHPDLARAEARITDSDLAIGLAAGPQACTDDLAIVVFTSGSTGLPRAVGQSHGNIVINATAVARHHNLDEKLSLFTCLPVFHVNALEFVVFGAMISGSRVFLAESFDPFSYLPALARSGAHIASTVPSLLHAVATGARRTGRPPGHLRYVVSAAAPLAAATARAVSESLGVPVVQGYGMSEAGNFSCLMHVRMREAAYRRLVTHAEIPSVGPAIWGNEVAVLDESGGRLPLGKIGEVGIRGHNVMLGYLDDDAATSAIFAGGWLHTGDLGRLIMDPELQGPMLQIMGRSKHVVKVHGHTVGFEEVERTLTGAVGISAVAATSVDHPVEGEVLCLLVVADDAAVNGSWVRAELSRKLGADYRPHTVHLVEALPLLHNGKIDRTAVRVLASRVR